MPQFLINANEAITSQHPYNALNDFAKGYVEAMFFTNCDSGDDNEFRANELGVDALTHDSVANIARYCARFEHYNQVAMAVAMSDDYDIVQAGRDLWFTAQGHGVGYWDRPQLSDSLRVLLTDGAKRAGEKYVEIGDDNEIYYR